MYQFSRAIYREIARDIGGGSCGSRCAHEQVLHACEATVTRMATDRHYFARPAKALFADIRPHFPITAQVRVWRVVDHYVAVAEEYLAQQPKCGYDAQGNPLRCRATTRRGTACQRDPLPHNGYCPSHQHLAETEEQEIAAAIAA